MRIAFGKQKPNRLQTHHAVCLWFKVHHIFNCGAIIFLPVPPTLGPPNNIISPLSEHPTPTLLSPLLTPPLLSLLTRAYLLNIAAPCQLLTLTITAKGKKQMNHSRQRERRAGRYGAGAIDRAVAIHLAPHGGRRLGLRVCGPVCARYGTNA